MHRAPYRSISLLKFAHLKGKMLLPTVVLALLLILLAALASGASAQQSGNSPVRRGSPGNDALAVDDLTWADLGQVSPDGSGLGGFLGTWDGFIVGGVHSGQKEIFSYNINNDAYIHTAMPASTGAMAQGDGPLVYVATQQTSGKGRLYSYDPHDNDLTDLGSIEAEYGQGVTVGNDGKVYVASCCAGNFSIHDPDTGSWDYRGRILTNYSRLAGLTTAGDGTIYGTTTRIWVPPYGGTALYKFDPATRQAVVIDTIVSGLHEAWNVQHNPVDHRIYGSVSYQMVPRLWVYDPQQSGLGIQDLGTIGSVTGEMYPGTMEISADGKIWAKVGPNLYRYDPFHHDDGIVPVATEVRGPLTFGRDGRLYRVAYGHLYRTDAQLAPGSPQEMFSDANPLQPLLLLPGWGAATSLSEDEMGFSNLSSLLWELGYREGGNLFYAGEPITSGYMSLSDNALSIRQYLCSVMPRIKTIYPGWDGSFDIIGHSYGGLRARAYLENPKLYGRGAAPCLERDPVTGDRFEIRVNNLFTLGSPHGGGDEYLPGAVGLAGIHLWGQQWESTAQLSDYRMYNFNNARTQAPGVCYHLIGGNAFQQNLPFVVDAAYVGLPPNDLGVYLRSALELQRWDNYPNLITRPTWDMHGAIDMPWLGSYHSYVGPDPWYTFNGYIKPYLLKVVSKCGTLTQSQLMKSATVDLSDETPLVPSILIASDLIGHGETQNGSFVVSEGGPSTFYLKWPAGDLDYSLIDANGATIDPITAETNPNVDYFDMEVMALTSTYIFSDTVPGTWSYSITGVDLPVETPYQLTMLPEAPVAVCRREPLADPRADHGDHCDCYFFGNNTVARRCGDRNDRPS